jgi:hypothetical protein
MLRAKKEETQSTGGKTKLISAWLMVKLLASGVHYSLNIEERNKMKCSMIEMKILTSPKF